jgi:rhodanese-related sulfurtransferase
MFGIGGQKIINMSPAEVKAGLDSGQIILVDVREADEHRGERIKGAISRPLSQLDPKTLPDANGKSLVLHCAGGVRSAKALGLCKQHGVAVDRHLAGGLSAWKANGLPTER